MKVDVLGIIVACGLTHVASIIVIWNPICWIEGWLKAATAALSILTVTTLARLYVARIGGEELVIIMEEPDSQSAQLIAERVRACVAALYQAKPRGRNCVMAWGLVP